MGRTLTRWAGLLALLACSTGCAFGDGTSWPNPDQDWRAPSGVILFDGVQTKYSTIGAAFGDASFGDIVLLGRGTYPESVTVPAGVTLQGHYGDSQAVITGSAATGTRVTLGAFSRLESVKVELPTDATPAIFYGSVGPAYITDLELEGKGASGIGIQQNGALGSALIVLGLQYNSGTAGCLIDVIDGTMIANDIQIGQGTFTDVIRVVGGAANVDTLVVGQSVIATDVLDIGAGRLDGSTLLSAGSGQVNCIHLSADGHDVDVVASKFQCTKDLLVDPLLTSGEMKMSASSATQASFDFPDAWITSSTATVLLQFQDDTTGDQGARIIGELHVGDPSRGSESVFGRGDSFVRGMVVKTNTNLEAGTWTDYSTEAASATGSTFPGLEGTAANQCLYVGSPYTFEGIKSLTTVALVPGTGALQWEYWTGTWDDIDHMATDANSPYDAHADTAFERVASEQVRFPPGLASWALKTLDGDEAYWARFCVATVLTGGTAPTLQQIKIHTDRREINADGAGEYFAAARPTFSYGFNLTSLLVVSGLAASNRDLDYSATIDLVVTRNRFASNATDGTGGAFSIQEGTDTSSPLMIKAAIYPEATGGDFEMVLTTATLEPGDPLDGTHAETVTPIVQTAGTTSVPQEFEWEVDISALIPGDTVAFAVTRDSTVGNDPPDTLAASVTLESFDITAVRWKD